MILVALAAAPHAWAQGDQARGADIARQWCSECHATETSNTGTDTAPAWRSIALDPAKNDTTLTTFLRNPHPAMRNIPLTEQDIQDVIAYIRALALE
jgi:mono/diheme cytochrome c family protein